eukprot:Anaeramoba_ignava/a613744_38.p1 GENE.a613744_38~~a613744_38.p1  ORF type:complete len:592 (-),score=209.23 a613744_38:11-1624(-)
MNIENTPFRESSSTVIASIKELTFNSSILEFTSSKIPKPSLKLSIRPNPQKILHYENRISNKQYIFQVKFLGLIPSTEYFVDAHIYNANNNLGETKKVIFRTPDFNFLPSFNTFIKTFEICHNLPQIQKWDEKKQEEFDEITQNVGKKKVGLDKLKNLFEITDEKQKENEKQNNDLDIFSTSISTPSQNEEFDPFNNQKTNDNRKKHKSKRKSRFDMVNRQQKNTEIEKKEEIIEPIKPKSNNQMQSLQIAKEIQQKFSTQKNRSKTYTKEKISQIGKKEKKIGTDIISMIRAPKHSPFPSRSSSPKLKEEYSKNSQTNIKIETTIVEKLHYFYRNSKIIEAYILGKIHFKLENNNKSKLPEILFRVLNRFKLTQTIPNPFYIKTENNEDNVFRFSDVSHCTNPLCLLKYSLDGKQFPEIVQVTHKWDFKSNVSLIGIQITLNPSFPFEINLSIKTQIEGNLIRKVIQPEIGFSQKEQFVYWKNLIIKPKSEPLKILGKFETDQEGKEFPVEIDFECLQTNLSRTSVQISPKNTYNP